MSDGIEPGAAALGESPAAAEPAPPEPAPAPPGGEAPAAPDPTDMTLVDHLGELRRRVAISIAVVILFSVLGFILAPQIIALMLTPLPGGQVVFLTLSGGFMVFLRIAVIVGIFLSLPVILYQLWAFVSPGLTPQERKAALPWIPMSVVFFLMGVLVAWVTLPFAVGFLLSFHCIEIVSANTLLDIVHHDGRVAKE